MYMSPGVHCVPKSVRAPTGCDHYDFDLHLLVVVDEFVWQFTRTLACECECLIIFGIVLRDSSMQKSPNTTDQWIQSNCIISVQYGKKFKSA
jgi:hypothetical protein